MDAKMLPSSFTKIMKPNFSNDWHAMQRQVVWFISNNPIVTCIGSQVLMR
jgi:hypothetical protein